jgi:hypothetical protein
MVALAIGTAGRYLIVAVVILLIVCVGVFLAFRASARSADREDGTRPRGSGRTQPPAT